MDHPPVNRVPTFPCVHPSVHTHRRQWIQQMAIAAAGTYFMPEVLAQPAIPHGFTLDLTAWKLGIPANQDQAIAWAHAHGFQSVGAHTQEIARWKEADFETYAQRLDEAKLTWSIASMPVAFEVTKVLSKESLATLPAAARALEKAGIERCITHIMPCHDTLTYRANFRQHQQRLRAIVSILSDHGLRFGMEYVGTQSLRNRRKFPFVHTLREGLELVDAIGSDQVGLVLDCWHWHNAQDTVEDFKWLKAHQVVSVELNDAQAHIPRAELQDGRRELPASTGVIDTKGFLEGLVRIGVQAPLMAEPFNQAFRDMPREQGIGRIHASLQKAMGLINA